MSADMKPPETKQDLLLEVRQKIYMRSVSGVFARWRWGMVAFTQVLFYGLPWLSWNERQAVLFDLASRKFHIFGLILYPQDFIYLTGLLIISAMSLFLFTTVAGRLWCGFTCPQTVYTEIFMWIERVIEGERGKRMKLDASPLSWRKIRIKAGKQAAWIAVALWTGFTFVGYFSPIRELIIQMLTISLGPWQSFWILFYGFATYGNAGFLREQVCKYMCPYARFQGVMFDRDTLVITYDPGRGEPRGSRSRKVDHKVQGLGDCINCSLCVQVCPTGIDIREGQQYECIGCAACIDACDKVMDTMAYPRGLIRYDTQNNMEEGRRRGLPWRRVFRPRVLVYSAVLMVAITVLLGSIVTRVPLKVDVLRDRGALSREVKNGLIENVYRLNVINGSEQDRRFDIAIRGLPGALIDTDDEALVEAGATRLVAVRLRADPAGGQIGSNRIEFIVTAQDDSAVQKITGTTFYIPDTPR